MEPHHRALILDTRRGAQLRRIDREREAFEPAPTIADAEMLQPVDQLRARGLVTALQDEGEEAGRTLEVARPLLVAGRSEERPVGKERVSTCRSWGSPYH